MSKTNKITDTGAVKRSYKLLNGCKIVEGSDGAQNFNFKRKLENALLRRSLTVH